MKIDELKAGMSNVSLQAKVVDKGEIRQVITRFGKRNVCDVLLEDDSGQIKLTLWEDYIKGINVGDDINIEGAFVSSFRGELQLNVPRRGKIEVLK